MQPSIWYERSCEASSVETSLAGPATVSKLATVLPTTSCTNSLLSRDVAEAVAGVLFDVRCAWSRGKSGAAGLGAGCALRSCGVAALLSSAVPLPKAVVGGVCLTLIKKYAKARATISKTTPDSASAQRFLMDVFMVNPVWFYEPAAVANNRCA
jgi:hypothetical protein